MSDSILELGFTNPPLIPEGLVDCKMGSILEGIESPQDIKDLNITQLRTLADEIRQYMLNIISQTGGHLAPNLGVVELTLALHLAFEVPRDKLIWDVGHQCYTHKILTGRKNSFATIRKLDGLSGFPKVSESPADSFDTGHSSTSVSAALGFVKARDMLKADYDVVAVLGDGALTGGLAYEGLNNAGDLKSPLIVVLNDNEMSIDNNVGAMSNYLVKLRTGSAYSKAKQEIENALISIPRVGPQVARVLDRFKDSLKYFLVDGMLFEELGFTYLGPFDGHNIEELANTFKRAKTMKRPVLVHVKTIKGKGYPPAEKNPDLFHGIGPFDLATGKPLKAGSAKTFTDIFGETIYALAKDDPKIVAITAAMTGGTGLNLFFNRFPERAFDVGIAEGHALTFGAGLAAAGLRPVIAVYATFLQRAYDNLIHDVCIQNLPVVIAVDRAGLVGEDGPTHHGIFDLAYLRTMVNLTIMAPKDGKELEEMLKMALKHNGPTAIRYPRANLPEYLTADAPLQWGKGQVLQAGGDVTLVTCGSMVGAALEAADYLDSQGLKAAVINVRFIKPLDEELLLGECLKSGKAVILEEHVMSGGLGTACAELFLNQPIQVMRFALPDAFIEQGKREELLDKYGLKGLKIGEKIAKRWFSPSSEVQDD